MFRLVGTSVFLGVVLAALALAASAATVPTDEAAYQATQVQATAATEPLDAATVVWAQRQPSGAASLPDAHERAAPPTVLVMTDANDRVEQPTVLVMTDANDRVAQPRVLAADSTDGISWTRTAVWALVGAAIVIAVVALAIALLGTPRGHPPLAHH